jgi:hypothetical protein
LLRHPEEVLVQVLHGLPSKHGLPRLQPDCAAAADIVQLGGVDARVLCSPLTSPLARSTHVCLVAYGFTKGPHDAL